MKKNYLLFFVLIYSVTLFIACKKEDSTTKASTTNGSSGPANNQLLFDGETVDFISAFGATASGKYTITGASSSGATLTIVLPDSIAPTADANYNIVPTAVGLAFNQATFNIYNAPKHLSENWGPFLNGSLELKIVIGKIQVKFIDVSSVKVGTIMPSIKASAQMTTL